MRIGKRRSLSLREEFVVLKRWTVVLPLADSRLRASVEQMRLGVMCAECGKLMYSRAEYEYDHEIPHALGGSDAADNLRPYCITRNVNGMVAVGCHNLKTARDRAAIAKAKRLAGETRNKPTRHPIRSRKRKWPKRKIPSRPRVLMPVETAE